ncbi:MAG TPA: ComEC/Rec2 family competence protein [Thiotrichales bacterium]|nr:MAG: hypothetical protein B7Y68_04220 [Thiotrichales bacterium 35-46-9]OZA74444.1 MAG: hypothetical protein B7X74_02505 [Thiotrichales bacterium 39-47-5]HQR81987.1 ComEC/Rec2 family competence protein [Thiotrichales bacterium]
MTSRSALDELAAFRRYRPWVLWLALAMTASAIGLAQLSETPEPIWRLLWLGMGLLSLSLWFKTTQRVIAYVLLGVALGGGLMHERMLHWQAQSIPSIWLNTTFPAQVVVDGIAKPTASGWSVLTRLVDSPSPALTHAQVLLTFPNGREPLAGEEWSVELRLRETQGRYNPAGIDFAAWLFAQNIQATGSVVRLTASERSESSWHWQSWRWLAMQKLLSVLPADSDFTGLSVALVLGEVSAVSDEQWRVLRDTGTLHMVVVSGTHITLVAGLAWFLGLALWKLAPSQRYPAVLVASLVALFAAVSFAFLAGMNVPVQRALIMFVMLMMAVWLKRSLHPVLTLSWALIAVLFWDVGAVMQVGFWLSFIATAILLWMLTLESGRLQRLLLLHLGMSLLLAPFLLLFFQQIPTYSALANLLTSPIIEWLLVPLLLIIALLAWIAPSLATLLSQLTEQLWALVWAMLSEIATWPMAVLLLSPTAWWQGLPDEAQRLTVLDMGRHEVVAVWQTPQGDWLMGTGSQQGKSHSMETIILPSLTALGVQRLAGVVMSDNSEAGQKGLNLLKQRMSVEQTLSSESCLQGEMASATSALPIQGWWSEHGQCWLMMNTQDRLTAFALSWQTPKANDWPYQMPIIAPALSAKPSADSSKVDLWISAGSPVRSGWAQQPYGTQQQGAMTWQISEQGFSLFKAYKPANQRFYHPQD